MMPPQKKFPGVCLSDQTSPAALLLMSERQPVRSNTTLLSCTLLRPIPQVPLRSLPDPRGVWIAHMVGRVELLGLP